MTQPLTPARQADMLPVAALPRSGRRGMGAWLTAGIAALLGACSTPAPAPRQEAPPPQARPVPVPLPVPEVIGPVPAPSGSARVSAATTPRAYRESGATHLYGLNADHIYKGRMPPMLHAVGVLNIEIDRVGQVTRLDWLRAPRHAPEVMAEIERMVRSAAPFPAPARMGKVVYTDTWLWHKSGRFQLDTLTEGQD